MTRIMRTKYAFLNMVFSTISMLTSSILSLLMTRVVLVYLGSEYNGLNGTISQFLSVLMLLESGFTLAALVKLYAPFGEQNYTEINRILSKARKELGRIGLLMTIFGVIGAAVYSVFIKTSVDYFVVVSMFVCSIASVAFNFSYVYKFRLVLQVSQREYVYYLVTIIQYIFMYCGMILIIRFSKNIILARCFYLATNIIAGFAVSKIVRRAFPSVRFDVESTAVKIEGTRDLFVSKLVGLLYNSLTLFYMSVFIGTLQASVYVIYHSVISVINSLLNIATSAPQNALGQIMNTERHRLKKTMREYEYVVVFMAVLLLSTTIALLIPFIRFYTQDITDVEYVQPVLAVLLIMISATQIVHIPSGRCIELSGNFKVVRNIQTITFILLLLLSLIGVFACGLTGLLFAQLLTNIALAAMEICYAHTKIINGAITDFLQILIPHFILACVLSCLEFKLFYYVELELITFILAGFAVLLVNTVILAAFGYLFFKEYLAGMLDRIRTILT